MNRSWALVAALPLLVSPLLAQKDSTSLALLQQVSTRLTQDQAVTSVIASGTIADLRSGLKRDFQLRALGADRIRWDSVNDSGQAVTTVIVGNGGWVEKDGRQVKVLSIAETLGRKLEFLPAAQLSDWIENAAVTLEPVVAETRDTKLLQRIGVRRPRTGSSADSIIEDITFREMLIDSVEAVPVVLRYRERSRDWRETSLVELEYSDFKEAAGFFVPLTVTCIRQGSPAQQIVFDSIVFNAPVSESDFSRSQ